MTVRDIIVQTYYIRFIFYGSLLIGSVYAISTDIHTVLQILLDNLKRPIRHGKNNLSVKSVESRVCDGSSDDSNTDSEINLIDTYPQGRTVPNLHILSINDPL